MQQSMAPGWEDSCHARRSLRRLHAGERLILLEVSSAGPLKGSSPLQHGPRLCFSSIPLPPARPRGRGLCQELNGFSLAAGWLGSAKHSARDPERKSKVRTRESKEQTRPQEEEQGRKRSHRPADQLAGTCQTSARRLLPKHWGRKPAHSGQNRGEKKPLFWDTNEAGWSDSL